MWEYMYDGRRAGVGTCPYERFREQLWLKADLSGSRTRSARLRHVCRVMGSNPSARVLSGAYLQAKSRIIVVAHPPAVAAFSLSPSDMFQSTSSFPTSTSNAGGQEQRSPFAHSHSHSHSHSVQYNGSPFSVAGMSNQTAASPSVRGSSLGMSMSSSLGMGSPLSESLSQSRSHYQPGYLMVRTPCPVFSNNTVTRVL